MGPRRVFKRQKFPSRPKIHLRHTYLGFFGCLLFMEKKSGFRGPLNSYYSSYLIILDFFDVSPGPFAIIGVIRQGVKQRFEDFLNARTP
jgi:hypothetical protein